MIALLSALCAGEDVVAGIVFLWARLVANSEDGTSQRLVHKVIKIEPGRLSGKPSSAMASYGSSQTA